MLAYLFRKLEKWALSKNPDGPYAGVEDKRWAWTAETDGSPYMSRIQFPWRVFGIKPMLNHFHRQDIDRDLHNHPWKWALSIVLCGSYDETRVHPDAEDYCKLYKASGAGQARRSDFTYRRRVRWWNLLRDTDYHKVDKLHGDVWTFFISGPKTPDGKWGFLVKDSHVDSVTYLGRGGKQ